MKSLAEFKRSLVLCDTYQVFNSRSNTARIATITKLQSNSFALSSPNGDSWIQYPPAKQVTFINNGNVWSVKFQINSEHYLLFTKIVTM